MVKISAIFPKCRSVVIDEDSVFDYFGNSFGSSRSRTLSALMNVMCDKENGEEPEEGVFILFHQWIVPRVRGVKRTKPVQGKDRPPKKSRTEKKRRRRLR
jgi:hypothetical protein